MSDSVRVIAESSAAWRSTGRGRPGVRARRLGGALLVAAAVTFAPSVARAQPVPDPGGTTPSGPRSAPSAPRSAPAPSAPRSAPSAPSAPKSAKAAPAWKAPPGIDDAVAKALYKRGMVLFRKNDYADAKEMFVESLERSPSGASAGDALRMLEKANGKLGLAARDGVPGGGASGRPLNPYGQAKNSAKGASAPLNPYGPTVNRAKVAAAGTAAAGEVTAGTRGAGTGLLVWSGALGLTAGLAVAGPEDGARQLKGGAVLAGLVGAGATTGLTYYLARHRRITPGQAEAIASAGTWGGYDMGLLGDVFTGVGTSTPNEIYKFVAAGGLAGAGAGIWYAASHAPSEGDVALVNSFGVYGTAAGFLLGVVMDPPTGEAYSLNGAIGSVLGLGAGLFLTGRVEASRSRMLEVDLGAVAGAAAPWVLVYPFISDSSTSSDERIAGALSLLTLGGGAYLAWRLTDDSGDGGTDAASQPPPALARRFADGRWRPGLPLPLPMAMPALAPPSRAPSFGIALAAGRF